MNAGQTRKTNELVVKKASLTIDVENVARVTSSLGLSAERLAKLESSISSELTARQSTTAVREMTVQTSLEDSYSLPPEPEHAGQTFVRARQFQSAPVFSRFRLVLERVCRRCKVGSTVVCGALQYDGVQQLRQVDFLSDGSEECTLTGFYRSG